MLDASTSKEQICFNAKMLDEHLPIAFLRYRRTFVLRTETEIDSEDVKKERQVVLRRKKMDWTTPKSLTTNCHAGGFCATFLGGRPISGTRKR